MSSSSSSSDTGARGQDMCACEANMPLVSELRKLDGECLRSGKVGLRYGAVCRASVVFVRLDRDSYASTVRNQCSGVLYCA